MAGMKNSAKYSLKIAYKHVEIVMHTYWVMARSLLADKPFSAQQKARFKIWLF